MTDCIWIRLKTAENISSQPALSFVFLLTDWLYRALYIFYWIMWRYSEIVYELKHAKAGKRLPYVNEMRHKSVLREYETNGQRQNKSNGDKGMPFVSSPLWLSHGPLQLVSFVNAKGQISDFQDLQVKDKRRKEVYWTVNLSRFLSCCFNYFNWVSLTTLLPRRIVQAEPNFLTKTNQRERQIFMWLKFPAKRTWWRVETVEESSKRFDRHEIQ